MPGAALGRNLVSPPGRTGATGMPLTADHQLGPRRTSRSVTNVVAACIAFLLGFAATPSAACGAECDSTTLATALPRGAPIETVGRPLSVAPVSAGFIGLSIEYYALQAYTGDDPGALNPVFLQLIKNLDPGQSPVIRIGGDSADWAWVPSPGLTRPAGARVTITPDLLNVMAALAADLDARFLLDLNLEADSVP